MNEACISIEELSTLSREDSFYRIRERVIDMYQRLGLLDDAIAWLWKDIEARQNGND